MSGEKKKKIGSFVPKDNNPKKSFWDYKPYIIVAVIIILGIGVLFLVMGHLGKNPAVKTEITPAAVEPVDEDTGNLEVETEPMGAVAQLHDRAKRTPVVFENVPSGTYFLILSYPGKKTISREVVVKKGETNKIFVKMDE